MMTFEKFQASKVFVEDLSKNPYTDAWEGAGWTYANELVIQKGASKAYCLTIANWSVESDDLEYLERELYDYALVEQIFEGEPIEIQMALPI